MSSGLLQLIAEDLESLVSVRRVFVVVGSSDVKHLDDLGSFVTMHGPAVAVARVLRSLTRSALPLRKVEQAEHTEPSSSAQSARLGETNPGIEALLALCLRLPIEEEEPTPLPDGVSATESTPGRLTFGKASLGCELAPRIGEGIGPESSV